MVGYEGKHIYRIYIPSRKTVIRSSNVRFDENSSLSAPSIEEERWESINYNPITQFDESEGGPTITSNQNESCDNFLTPFEQLSFDDYQQDVNSEILQDDSDTQNEQLRDKNSDIENEDNLSEESSVTKNLQVENLEPLSEERVIHKGRPLGSKNKVYQRVIKNTRSTAASSVSDQKVAFQSFVTASQSIFTVNEKSDPHT